MFVILIRGGISGCVCVCVNLYIMFAVALVVLYMCNLPFLKGVPVMIDF